MKLYLLLYLIFFKLSESLADRPCSLGEQEILMRCQEFCDLKPVTNKLLPCGQDCFTKYNMPKFSQETEEYCKRISKSEELCEKKDNNIKKCNEQKIEVEIKKYFWCLVNHSKKEN